MLIEGKVTLKAPIQKIWDSVLVPEILSSCVPGGESMEKKDLKKCLLHEMKELPERTREMLYSMFFSDKLPTLGDLSDRFGVSKERCRQICARGLQLLRQQIEDKWTMTGDLEAFGIL